MPVLGEMNEQMTSLSIGHFGFSGARIEELGASEYTLCSIVADRTGSVADFETVLRNAVIDSVKACKKSPKRDNLLVRHTRFSVGSHTSRDPEEIHGFMTLDQIFGTVPAEEDQHVDQLYPIFGCYGSTNLYDATAEAVMTMDEYAKHLRDNDFYCNGIIFVITDGMDNESRMTRDDVKEAIVKAQRNEYLETLVVILIGVNAADCQDWLDMYKEEAGLNQYVDIQEFDATKGAKLAEFISKSTSTQSQALGTGSPSQPLRF